MTESNKILIYGNGSMAKVLYSYAKDIFNIYGFTVDDCCIKDNEEFCSLPIVPFSSVEKKFNPKEYKMISSVGFLEMNELRENKYKEAKEKGYEFVSYVDKTVKIHDGVEIGENCIILDFVSIHPGTKIKKGTFISSNVNIAHDCNIGEYNWINSGVSIAGFANIGKSCFWGVNSSCSDNLTIGNNNYISANTLINKNTQDGEVYISPCGEKFKLSSSNFLKFIGRAKNE